MTACGMLAVPVRGLDTLDGDAAGGSFGSLSHFAALMYARAHGVAVQCREPHRSLCEVSAEALAWAWRQPVPDHGSLVVLLKLADQANDDGVCWPSRRTIAEHCRLSVRTIVRKIEAMETAGLLRVEPRARDDGSRTSNLYMLNLTPPPCHPDTPPVSRRVARHEPQVNLSSETEVSLAEDPAAPPSPTPSSSNGGADRTLNGTPSHTPPRAEAMTATADGSPDAPGSLFGPEATSESVAPPSSEPRPATRRTRPQGATQAPPPQAARKRDPIWDALEAIFGTAPAGMERGRWNAAAKSLRADGATAEQVAAAADAYPRVFAGCAMTPTALAANWTTLTRARDGPGPRRTGWRFVRGSHGSTYVQDPDGTDTPPKGYG